MNLEKLCASMYPGEHRLNLALEALDALWARKRVSNTFRLMLREAVQGYQDECNTYIQGLEEAEAERLADVETNYRHERGLSMPAVGEPVEFLELHVTYPQPRPTGQTGEYLWARRLGKNKALVDNIPYFCPHLTLGALVRIRQDGEVSAVLEHGARTEHLQYADATCLTQEQLYKRYFALQERLKSHDIRTEILEPGVCCASVPDDLDDDELALVAEEAGVEVLHAVY